MNVISLASGIGGLDYGLALAIPETRTVAYCEIDPFCQDILLARMADGVLDRAPIWNDLRSFDGYPWRGIVDCVASGFPCQPFSHAGKRQGEADARNLWPDVRRVILESQPAIVILENVPGALPYFFHVVLPDLQGMGYAAQAGLVTAAEVGAPHRRQRVFIVAHTQKAEWWGAESADDSRGWTQETRRSSRVASNYAVLEHSASIRLAGRDAPEHASSRSRMGSEDSGSSALPPWPPGPTERDRWAAVLERWPELAPAVEDSAWSRERGLQRQDGGRRRVSQAGGKLADATNRNARRTGSGRDPRGATEGVAAQSPLRRVASGLPHRVDRLCALGNAVVPAQAAHAILTLLRQVNARA